jgi:hypothetical protein
MSDGRGEEYPSRAVPLDQLVTSPGCLGLESASYLSQASQVSEVSFQMVDRTGFISSFFFVIEHIRLTSFDRPRGSLSVFGPEIPAERVYARSRQTPVALTERSPACPGFYYLTTHTM